MKEMIRRFDEVISEKVSKVTLEQYSKDARALYITVFDFKNSSDTLINAQSQMQTLLQNLETRVTSQNA